MSKRTSPVPTKLFRWRVIRLRGSPALWVGEVDAPDEPSAIEAAIKIYNITDPEHQKRLAVRRIKYVGSLDRALKEAEDWGR